jgi:hypothetical protein
MTEPDEHELDPIERDALAALPKERDPGPELRARVVEALRERGAFGANAPLARGPLPVLLRVAAAALVFLAGVAVGVALPGDGSGGGGDAATEGAVPDVTRAPTTGVDGADGAVGRALRVQRLGSAYVEAIAGLGDAVQGREAALSAFRGAAEQLARLPGQDVRTRDALLAIRGMGAPADSVAVERWF